ncbi:protein of unknown function DUF1634 [Allomeiothermus silvanus DSM 9946]|uniref:DUF1634 domain-containing protein n=1 Tax=Allomeiothermus silvanus (strain ATCC 700542 / DSM 9946 / NBRC 106475 / NCIMB 13440 / VI-R2) TaxID=526227 RepID=D7BEA7_ALLS1|nr:DUF1634 domain-containing protein [Allomeiothermus silvanus]ADH64965.1 protein of unknown function DUF1634 [Allomeiothermus silvanus DSM 9946]
MTDRKMEILLGNLLRLGVLVAGAVVLGGGLLELISHGSQGVDYSVFRGEPASLRSLTSVLQGAVATKPKHLIQIGLLLLVLTPVLRVALSVLLFAQQRDGTFVGITLWVLGVLLYSLAL